MQQTQALSSVQRFLSRATAPTKGPATEALCEKIHQRFQGSLEGIIFYGSVLHGLAQKADALYDLLVVVSSYSSAYDSLGAKVSNWILPPNVFYLEAEKEGNTYRCKYAVVSLKDFQRYTGPSCKQVYFWGRYTQPTQIALAKNDESREQLVRILSQAAQTFVSKSLCLHPKEFCQTEFWIKGLASCYGCELRPEDRERSRRIVDQAPTHYRTLSLLLLPTQGSICLDPTKIDTQFTNPYSGFKRTRLRWGWTARRLMGKSLNLLRIIKAVFTFDGGVDYALWKIRRHAHVEIEVSDRVKKHPLIFGWWTFYKLWRQGVFATTKSAKKTEAQDKESLQEDEAKT